MSFFGIPMRNGLSLGLGTVASLTNGPGFLPDELFYGGTVQGAWYDPSDLTTLFQDSAGTTPVTAVEQAVGLMLDKSKGLVLGAELAPAPSALTGVVSNFSGSSGTFSGGVFSATCGTVADYPRLQISILGVAIGRRYLITLGLSISGAITSVRARFALSGASNDIGTLTSSGILTARQDAAAANVVELVPTAPLGGTFTVTVTSISVRELPGNHAFQSINTSRPTLRARYNLLRYSEEIANGIGDWVVNNATVTANNAASPIGTITASRIVADGTSTNPGIYNAQTAVPAGVTAIFSVWLRGQVGGEEVSIGDASSRQTVTLTTSWQRFTNPSHALLSNNQVIYAKNNTVMTFFAWGAQLVPTAVFPSNTYQRIGAATDYATGAAFPPYLFFDGTDDSMLTNSVDFATVTSDGQARRNLLLNPTQFDDAYWVKGTPSPVVTISANSTTDPFGGSNADTMTETATTASHGVASGLFSFVSGTSYAMSAYAKNAPGGRGFFQLAGFGIGAAGANVNANFDLVNGTVTAQSGGTGSIQDVGNGWYRCIFVFTCGTSASERFNLRNITSSTAPAFESYLGDITKGLYVYGAQLETGSTATAFQNIGTDKMLVVAGVTKNSDAAIGMLTELGASATSGSFYVLAPNGAASAGYQWRSRGTSNVDLNSPLTYAAPITNVLAGIGDIAAPQATLRINGTQVATSSASQGTGNYDNYPIFIGRRNNASLPFNGNLYSLIIAGQSYSSGQISSTESWVAAKTPLGTI